MQGPVECAVQQESPSVPADRTYSQPSISQDLLQLTVTHPPRRERLSPLRGSVPTERVYPDSPPRGYVLTGGRGVGRPRREGLSPLRGQSPTRGSVPTRRVRLHQEGRTLSVVMDSLGRDRHFRWDEPSQR